MKLSRFFVGTLLATSTSGLFAQELKINDTKKNLTFTGTQAIQRDSETDSTGKLILSGYISTYFAGYNDSIPRESFQQLPTVAPYSNKFGLNIAQIGLRYTSDYFRGTATFHFGDIPQSAWSSKYNVIQEANVGGRLAKGLWLDVGLFRTHIGLESIQPRENIASSIATTTYFEPYFMSGAKLTYTVNSKVAVQANAFNSFNSFVETNKNKAFGLSAVITPNEHYTLTINTITSDESPDSTVSHQRLYNNVYLVYRSDHFDLGAEYNLGMQRNTSLSVPGKTAIMQSALLALKYKFNKHFALYARGEYFRDPDEMLTGPVINSHHNLVGLDILGETLGVEVKLIDNSYIRLEGRTLHTKTNEDIFTLGHQPTNHREELIFSMGVWF